MLIAIDSNMFYALIIMAILAFIALIGLYMAINKNAPDAMTHWKAKRQGKPIVRVHYRGKGAKDYIAEVDPKEKDLGAPEWVVPDVGLKFKPSADDIEIIEGSITCANYFTNLTEAMSIAQVVAFHQIKKWFGKHNMPLDTIEGVAFYVAQDYIKTGDKKRALANARLESKEIRTYLMKYLDLIDAHRTELDRKQLEEGVFSFQTAMKALDAIEATTSSHVEHLKKVVRAAALRELEDANAAKRNIVIMAIAAFIVCIGAAAFLLVVLKH